MLTVTVSLGIWQIQRLHWKQGLLAEIDRAEAAPPVPMPANPAPFEKVEITGALRADLTVRYGTEVRSGPTGPVLGSQVVMPLERPGAPPVLVDRGWAPDDLVLPVLRGPVTVTGYVRPGESGSPFAPGPDLARRRFWSLDPVAIGAALGLPTLAPYTIVVLGSATTVPEPAHALPRPSNDHLGYAGTWFGLAACLAVVFTLFVRKALRA